GSDDFPIVNAVQPAKSGDANVPDAFVAKLKADGSALAFSTYLGGSNFDLGAGIALDDSDNVYVTGDTYSDDFPTVNALQPDKGSDDARDFDAFVAKLQADGTTLVYATYLGGSRFDVAVSVAVDNAGNAYVTGGTASADFPTMNAMQPALDGITDAF